MPDITIQPVETAGNSDEWLLKLLASNDEYKCRYGNSSPLRIEYEEVGRGYTSKIVKASIYFTGDHQCFVVALKLPYTSGLVGLINSRKDPEEAWNLLLATLRRLHNRECAFYEHVSKMAPLPAPKMFGLKTMGSEVADAGIIMEYIPKELSTQLKMHVSFNENQILSIARIVSKLATVSLMLDDSTMEQWTPYAPEYIYPAYEKRLADNVLAQYPGHFDELVHRMKHIYTKDFLLFIEEKIHKELGVRPIIVHGDAWANNILWKRREDGSCGDEIYALFDWQLMHCANITRDLALVLVVCTDAELRRKMEAKIWNILYNYIQEEMDKAGLKGPVPYTVEQMKACYRREFIRQTLKCFFYHDVFCPRTASDEIRNTIRRRIKEVLLEAVPIVEKELPHWHIEGFKPPSSLPSGH